MLKNDLNTKPKQQKQQEAHRKRYLMMSWLCSLFSHCPSSSRVLLPLLDGETGSAAGDPCVAMKSASCLSAHRLDELPPFFICSWINPSSSSRKDCTQKQTYFCDNGESELWMSLRTTGPSVGKDMKLVALRSLTHTLSPAWPHCSKAQIYHAIGEQTGVNIVNTTLTGL